MNYRVERSYYPEKVPWDKKRRDFPTIPGNVQNCDTFINNLRIIFLAIKNDTSLNSTLQFIGSKDQHTLGEYCRRLHGLGVKKNGKTYGLSEEAERWLDSEDNDYITAVFAAKTAYFIELLVWLSNPKTRAELAEIAKDKYYAAFKGDQALTPRLNWYRALNFVSINKNTGKFAITEDGKLFLDQNLSLVTSPDELNCDIDSEEVDISISDWAIDLCTNTNRIDNTSFLLLGDKEEYIRIINTALDYISERSVCDFSSFSDYLCEHTECDKKTVRSFMHTLYNLTLIELDNDKLSLSNELGRYYLRDKNELDLLCIFHNRYRCFFEILLLLSKRNYSLKEIRECVEQKYSISSKQGIENRVRLLESANLIKRVHKKDFCITNRGTRFLDIISLFEEETDHSKKDANKNSNNKTIDDIIEELINSSTDSDNPTRFEKALVGVFKSLYFETKHIGGSNEPDLIIDSYGVGDRKYRVTVDAKSSKVEKTTVSGVNFDAICKHRERYHADYSLIVAPDFSAGDLVKYAEDRNVALISTEKLKIILEKHQSMPLSSDKYRALFEQKGIVDISFVDQYRKTFANDANLIYHIFSILEKAYDNKTTDRGEMKLDTIKFMLGERGVSDNNLDEKVQEIIDILSLPMIGAVEKTFKDSYRLLISITETKDTIRAMACAIENVIEENN